MPIYEIEAPNGQVLEIEGDKLPTEQELKDIFAKVNASSSSNITKNKNIVQGDSIPSSKQLDLTPSGLVNNTSHAIASALTAPIGMIKDKQGFKQAYNKGLEQLEDFEKKNKGALGKFNDFVLDTAIYSQLPILKGGGIVKGIANAAIQGGIPAALETVKKGGNAIQGASIGTALAGTLQGLPRVGKVASSIWGSQKSPLSIITGLKDNTLKRAIDPDSVALDLSENAAAQLLGDVTQQVRNAYQQILEKRGQAVAQAAKNLSKDKNVNAYDLYDDLKNVFNDKQISQNTLLNETKNESKGLYKQIEDLIEKARTPQEKIDKINFANAYGDMLEGKLNPHKEVTILSNTPQIWQNVGVPNQAITTSQKVLKKMGNLSNVYNKNHNLSDETLKNLPELLYNPKYILKSDTQPGRYVGVLDDFDSQGRQILGILSPNGKVNFVPSAYGRNNFDSFLNNQAQKGNLLYNKGATPTPTIGVGQVAPNNSIAQLPQKNKVAAPELFQLLRNVSAKSDWKAPNDDLREQAIQRLYGAYTNRLSNLSPELKQANKAFSDLKNFEMNDGVKQVLRGDLGSQDVVTSAISALKNYDNSILKSKVGKNIQDLEKILVNEGYEPFLNKIDDVNAAQDILDSIKTGFNFLGANDLRKALTATGLKVGREFNRTMAKYPKLGEIGRRFNQIGRRAITPMATQMLPLQGSVTKYADDVE